MWQTGSVLSMTDPTPGSRWPRAVRGQPVREPERLAVDEIVDLSKAEPFEPPRGSRAHVSKRVPAVHDDRLRALQDLDTREGQSVEWDVDRTG